MMSLRYILITPARNEAHFLEGTAQSMAAQSHPPVRWVIVSDGSTDGTDEIARKFADRYQWIEYLRMPDHADRQFAAKVFAFNAGYEKVKHIDHDIVGNLDADLTFDPDYFDYLLTQFELDPSLGVGGTPFVEEGTIQYDYRFTNINHVSGACQLFRQRCFSDIGGYQPIPGGGIDWVAVTTARLRGWKTRTFTGKVLYHHRKMGTGNGRALSALYRLGGQDYYLGNHPLWEFLRMFYQMRYRPMILGGLVLYAGYAEAALRRIPRTVSPELARFIRREQMSRLAAKISRKK